MRPASSSKILSFWFKLQLYLAIRPVYPHFAARRIDIFYSYAAHGLFFVKICPTSSFEFETPALHLTFWNIIVSTHLLTHFDIFLTEEKKQSISFIYSFLIADLQRLVKNIFSSLFDWIMTFDCFKNGKRRKDNWEEHSPKFMSGKKSLRRGQLRKIGIRTMIALFIITFSCFPPQRFGYLFPDNSVNIFTLIENCSWTSYSCAFTIRKHWANVCMSLYFAKYCVRQCNSNQYWLYSIFCVYLYHSSY